MGLLKAALWWLRAGVSLVPVQPGSKRLVEGFGPYRRQVRDREAARFWWGKRSANLGLVCGGGQGLNVLDFDDPVLYRRWLAVAGGVAETFTVATAQGFHVYVFAERCETWAVDGLDVQGAGCVVVTAPSIHPSGARYRAIDWRREVWTIAAPAALPLLSGLRPERSHAGMVSLSKGEGRGGDLVARVKRAFPVADVAQELGVNLRSSDGGRGRWFVGLCPFHDDHHPSFWVDARRGLWGCWSCKVKGDSINLYAKAHGLGVQAAIRDMAGQIRGLRGD